MSAVVFAFSARKSEPRPWQNDELAEFYRVIDMLGRAGLGVVPDMGVSDEGDPWFAFCRADTGDVVVHCARIDGVCVASSIATTEVFRGTSIRDVVNAIIRGRQAALVVASSADGRVYLHPTVVLTAFIAAALLFSNQASAHDLHYLHSDGSGTVSELPVTLTKFIAALREIVHEAVGPVTTSLPNVDQTPTGELEPEPFSLAALLSAAMTVIAPVILGSEGFFDSNLPAASLSNPADLPTLHSMDPLPPFENGVQGTTILQSIDPLSSTLGISSASPKIPDFIAGSANLLVSLIGTALDAHPNGGVPSFLSASESSTPSFVIHAPVAPFHNGMTLVSTAGDASSSTIGPPISALHNLDLSEITPTALAVFFGDAYPPLAATTAIASSSGPFSPAVDTSPSPGPTGDAADSSPSSGPTGDAADSSPSSGPTGDAVDSSSSSPPTPVVVDSSSSSPPTPVVVDSSSSSSPTIAPTDSSSSPSPTTGTSASIDPLVPTDAPASSSATSSTIDMASNPIVAIEQLLNYAQTSHPINATVTVPSDLSIVLHTYEGESTQPVQLIVFDSSAVNLPYFEFIPGVFFVDDHDLGLSPSQASPAQLVTVDLATGGTMQLLGVVSTANLTF